jgi:uncharacterized protein
MRPFITIGQALAISLAQITLCNAASFNCQPYLARGTCPEALICSESRLSRLDETMASLYQDARSKMSDSLTTGFRNYQREWLARRGQCGCDFKCLDSEYRTQIDALRKTLDQMGR